MRLYLRTCCFCIKLKRGFSYILFIDFARFLWVILFIILFYIKSSSTVIDYIFDGLVTTSIIYQTFRTLISLNEGQNRTDFSKHKNYLISKILFVFTNSLRLGLKPKFKCLLNGSFVNCYNVSFDEAYLIDIIWTLLDAYSIIVIYSFCLFVYKGIYTPIGGIIIFCDLKYCEKAIDIEVIGHKVNKAKVEIEQSFAMPAKNCKFAKITPYPKSKINKNTLRFL